jgi:two-component system, NtrC family, sensor kinase
VQVPTVLEKVSEKVPEQVPEKNILSEKSILIVDDMPINLKLLMNILVQSGYDVRPATSGRQAIEAIGARLPDLILLDIAMPEMDGYEVCQSLKQDPHTAEIPVIFISAANEVMDKVRAFQVGGVDYITKPFQVEEVLARIETQFSIRDLQLQLQAQNDQLTQTITQLKATQTQLVLSEKMAVLGQLVASVAHEMNTPLGVIRASVNTTDEFLSRRFFQFPIVLNSLSPDLQALLLQMVNTALDATPWILQTSSRDRRMARRSIERQLDALDIPSAIELADILVDIGIYQDITPFLGILQHPDVSHLIEAVYGFTSIYRSNQMSQSAVERASIVVQALRRYAYAGDPMEPVPTNLVDSIETLLTLYHNQMRNGVEVVRDYQPIPLVMCYADELQQLWNNLIQNALQAMSYRGKMTVSMRRVDDRVTIAIADSGHGIPAEIQGKIFEPFFTTKAMGEGNGLGLSIVQNIVDRHGGSVRVESQPGNTKFTIELPIAQPE